ncbi:hypothetical protein C8P66_10667 [Humitalea rosea]|uniref:Uncharacterized protein n=1 Tax=Humitalea rosea TaxID=990373 RepID=A0A2W7J8F4_9PROT|nr:hypothetical protein C8P66_10667 [Humitalea rosea]
MARCCRASPWRHRHGRIATSAGHRSPPGSARSRSRTGPAAQGGDRLRRTLQLCPCAASSAIADRAAFHDDACSVHQDVQRPEHSMGLSNRPRDAWSRRRRPLLGRDEKSRARRCACPERPDHARMQRRCRSRIQWQARLFRQSRVYAASCGTCSCVPPTWQNQMGTNIARGACDCQQKKAFYIPRYARRGLHRSEDGPVRHNRAAGGTKMLMSFLPAHASRLRAAGPRRTAP